MLNRIDNETFGKTLRLFNEVLFLNNIIIFYYIYDIIILLKSHIFNL